MKIGFIGLGTMGGKMAANLQRAGLSLVVNDLRREAAETHVAAGGAWADTPGDVGEQADVVFTSLPGPPEVREIAPQLLEGMRRGTAWFDLTTNSPTLIRELHAQFAQRGVHVLDCPVSGGPDGAASGRLALWIGGDEAIVKQHQAVLEAIGDQVIYVGPIGAGCVTKLVHNCTGYAVQAIMAEVFSLGVKAGVDPLDLWKAVRQGAIGRRRTFDRLAEQFLGGTFERTAFALRLAHKDVTLATELGRELRVPMRMANLALEELTEGLNRGWGARDSRIAMLLEQERAGVRIQVEESRLKAVLDEELGAVR